MPFWTFSNIKYQQNTIKMNIDKYFFQNNKNQRGGGDIKIYGHPGGQNVNIWQKNTPNVSIYANNFKIWTILQWKLVISVILDEVW